MTKNANEVIEQEIETDDIYHEIGKIYCQTLEKIERIDYIEIKDKQVKEVYVRLKEKETGKISTRVLVSDIINGEDIEFDFGDDEIDYTTLPYHDYLFYKNDYELMYEVREV